MNSTKFKVIGISNNIAKLQAMSDRYDAETTQMITFKESRTERYSARGEVNFFKADGQPTRTVMLQETTPLAMIFKAEDDYCVVAKENLETF